MSAFFGSFRGRLTLWSLAVLAISLVSFSLVLGYATVSRMAAGIDRELADRGRRLASGGPPNGPPEGPGPGFGGGPAGLPPEPFTFGDSESDTIASIRRPRFFDAFGHRIGGANNDQPFDPHALAAALRGEESYSTVAVFGGQTRIFTATSYREGAIVGAVQVARELRDYEELKTTQVRAMMTLIPLALVVTALGAFMLTGRALRPLKDMGQAAAAIGEGDLGKRLDVVGSDEIAELASTINGMAERLQLSFSEQEAAYTALTEAYEAQKRFTADASHELRTPLARLQLATSSALEGKPEGYQHALETADRAGQAMSKLVRQLLTLARADAGQLGLSRKPLDLRLPVSNAANLFGGRITVVVPDMPVTVSGDEDHLERVVTNLLENAIRHTPRDGSITTRLATDGVQAMVEVTDTGEGIAGEHLSRVFERFYRVDEARSISEGGAGLGLAISKSIVEAHGGTISLDSEIGKGTTVKIILPLMKSS